MTAVLALALFAVISALVVALAATALAGPKTVRTAAGYEVL